MSWNTYHVEMVEKYKTHLDGLYELMANKMEFFNLESFKHHIFNHNKVIPIKEINKIINLAKIKITEDDQYLVIKIEEALGK